MNTTYPIHGFIGYYFDADKNQVLRDSKTGPKPLKAWKYESGLERLTLYRNGNPYYVFTRSIHVEGSFARIIQGKKFDAINNLPTSINTDPVPTKTPTPKKEKAAPASEDEDQNVKNLNAFFEARNNNPIRKDGFLKKFSKQVFEAYSDMFTIEKTEKGTFISLK